MVHLVEDSFVLVIEIAAVAEYSWGEVDQKLVRAAGFKTTDEWKASQAKEGPVWACVFQVAEDARYLHRRIARGYTRNPALGLPEQALDDADLQRYSSEAWVRQAERRKMVLEAKSLAERVRDLERAAGEGDDGARRSLFVIRQRVEAAERKRGRDAA